jgi:hypothetical protein
MFGLWKKKIIDWAGSVRAIDIHPIVGTQRSRFGERKNATVSINAKSIMTAKVEVVR